MTTSPEDLERQFEKNGPVSPSSLKRMKDIKAANMHDAKMLSQLPNGDKPLFCLRSQKNCRHNNPEIGFQALTIEGIIIVYDTNGQPDPNQKPGICENCSVPIQRTSGKITPPPRKFTKPTQSS